MLAMLRIEIETNNARFANLLTWAEPNAIATAKIANVNVNDAIALMSLPINERKLN